MKHSESGKLATSQGAGILINPSTHTLTLEGRMDALWDDWQRQHSEIMRRLGIEPDAPDRDGDSTSDDSGSEAG